jgi:hypothetical protein
MMMKWCRLGRLACPRTERDERDEREFQPLEWGHGKAKGSTIPNDLPFIGGINHQHMADDC